MKEKIEFRNVVAETLLIPLCMRARESRRKDAILYDPEAERLMESIEYDYGKFGKAPMSALGCVVRGRYYDDRVQSFIRRNARPVVVDVGCGLDTRFQRIAERRDAVFYELDLPEVMAIREKLLPAPAGDNYVAGSLLDTEWMDALRGKHPDGHFIFVFEGVLMYFYEKQVRTVLRNIAERFPAGEVCFDVCGPMMVKTGLKPDSLRRNAAEIRSGMADGHKTEQWEPRLRLIEQRSYMEFARRRWGAAGIFFRAFPRLALKFSSLLAYEIAGAGTK